VVDCWKLLYQHNKHSSENMRAWLLVYEADSHSQCWHWVAELVAATTGPLSGKLSVWSQDPWIKRGGCMVIWARSTCVCRFLWIWCERWDKTLKLAIRLHPKLHTHLCFAAMCNLYASLITLVNIILLNSCLQCSSPAFPISSAQSFYSL
jgi:hypothetical protein